MHRRFAPILVLFLAASCQTPEPAAEQSETRVVYLQHVASKDVVDTLQQMGLPTSLNAFAEPSSNSVMLQGGPEVLQQAVTLVTALDKPAR